MFDEIFNNPVIVILETSYNPDRHRKDGSLKFCVDCKENKRSRNAGTLLCNECIEKQNHHLKLIVRDVETEKETDFNYTIRKSQELGLGYTKGQIKHSLYVRQLTPEMILWGGRN